MADFAGDADERLGLTELVGANRLVAPSQETFTFKHQGAGSPNPEEVGGVEDGGIINRLLPLGSGLRLDRRGEDDPRMGNDDMWFERAIVIPSFVDLGNILSTTVIEATLYSSYRLIDIQLDAVVNNLGDGVTISGLPSLPSVFDPQSQIVVDLIISAIGVSTLDDTVDWEFDVSTEFTRIAGSRVIMFPYQPDVPLRETLGFMTNIIEHIDGTEQRISVRKNPRQEFQFELYVADDDRRRMDNLLLEWQSRIFGLPLWTQHSHLLVAATLGQFTVQVDDTTTGEFIVGGSAILLLDSTTFEALEIQSTTSTTITFTSEIQGEFPIGTSVYPLRTALLGSRAPGSMALNREEKMNLKFRITDNEMSTGFADASSFSTYNSRVLLDGPNASVGKMTINLQKKLYQLDNDIGSIRYKSNWHVSKRSSVKGFVTTSRQQLYDTLRLLHFLRGRQIAFYLPTFTDDVVPAADLQDTSVIMVVRNFGFTQFAQSNPPSRGIIQVTLTDGSTLIRQIVSSEEVIDDNEQLTLDLPWTSDVPLGDIATACFVELVRIDTDNLTIKHNNALGSAEIYFPVKTVFDDV